MKATQPKPSFLWIGLFFIVFAFSHTTSKKLTIEVRLIYKFILRCFNNDNKWNKTHVRSLKSCAADEFWVNSQWL